MCYGDERFPSKEGFNESAPARPATRPIHDNEAAVEGLLNRLAETEARLERARAREAELSRQLEEMKRFVSVMEILETYLKRRYREEQDQLYRLYLPVYDSISFRRGSDFWRSGQPCILAPQHSRKPERVQMSCCCIQHLEKQKSSYL